MTRRPLKKRGSRHPFPAARVEWAHHVGGYDELQFNVALDQGRLRWGIAISLIPNPSLTDPTVIYPKLRKLSFFLKEHGEYLHKRGFLMWDYTDQRLGRVRSHDRTPQGVSESLYRSGAFVFVGKHAPVDRFDACCVLRDFDVLLPVYEFVEFESDTALPVLYQERGFLFEADAPTEDADRPLETTATRTIGANRVSLRHRALQDSLKHQLQLEGLEVGTELRDGNGGYIDLVARREGRLEFYEIKTDESPRLCIRHAIGQLLEYGYWGDPVRPSRLIVVGGQRMDQEAADYLRTLRSETGLTISYQQAIPAGR